MDEDDLGPKRIVALQKEAQEWTRRAEEAIVSIQDITVNYFRETVKALAGVIKEKNKRLVEILMVFVDVVGVFFFGPQVLGKNFLNRSCHRLGSRKQTLRFEI